MNVGRALPPREMVLEAHELEREGLSRTAIGRKLGVANDTVIRWLGRVNNPESRAQAIAKWDPYIDEVAVRRAVKGDQKVWENLTVFEREEVRKALLVRLEREPLGPEHISGERETFWLTEWSESVGMRRDGARAFLRRAPQPHPGSASAALAA
jgi:hypothetical protein